MTHRSHNDYLAIFNKVVTWQMPRMYPGNPDAELHPEDWSAFASSTLEVMCLTLSAIDSINEE